MVVGHVCAWVFDVWTVVIEFPARVSWLKQSAGRRREQVGGKRLSLLLYHGEFLLCAAPCVVGNDWKIAYEKQIVYA